MNKQKRTEQTKIQFPKALMRTFAGFMLCFLAAGLGALRSAEAGEAKILNVSYDVTREFYQDFNASFIAHWKEKTGDIVTVNQSHGGSSKQARSVIDGLEADVVTMNQALDIDIIHERAQLIPKDWASRLPHNSVPYTSTILFIVRKGNSKGIQDWADLVKPGVSSIIPNPKTSGNGRYSYLAAWGYALKQSGGDKDKAGEFVGKLFASVPVLDAGGRAATTTFAQREIGDVLLTFENEVELIRKEFGVEKFDVIVPSISILAENPVVWIDSVVNRHGTAGVAQAYLEYLFGDAGQELAAKHFFRPQKKEVLAKYSTQFKPLELFSVAEAFGSWSEAQRIHFNDGGLFDHLYRRGK
jgi:sulfate/thiosulfate transport system substrate-binding protein